MEQFILKIKFLGKCCGRFHQEHQYILHIKLLSNKTMIKKIPLDRVLVSLSIMEMTGSCMLMGNTPAEWYAEKIINTRNMHFFFLKAT